ncbi:LLM class flavin-dependent oxidoreductase [Streptomyces albidoflavus]|uniref:FMNH2-utilizing oxygenase n=7 Tax=Streptomyces TaxID=1883 RepID=A0A126Y9Y7_9ACTN|nr:MULTISPECIES: LLM class flavin-dependent oxidoreductase [Streptomyces]MYQ72088.1 LLM class flavin-dependent oxidoreductase [Streptomyces sp. SID4934]MYW58314.1 LLM class flavin-dependent oxidoreductase [Streptomyces sp. SID8370]MYW87690.1 LLM class flavin-dependent oxidoreductase [Streptomyces sp. SID8371]NUW07356.1 LLM class flavin-dependent oxidoreductase [Streptomyces sp. CAI-21]QLA59700.1 LLM class flavin-dependent oxidoreductase [Streptomyces violascens]BDH54189.1 putative FMNH2-utili
MPEPHKPTTLHLAAALSAPGAPRPYTAADWTRRVRLAEDGALDFVTLTDAFGERGPDALQALTVTAPATARVGLVPAVTTTHTEPFHLQAAVATLDWVSGGRAGWLPAVSTTEAEARLFGRRPAAPAAALWHEAAEVAEAAGRLWDSWEDDAEIRDLATGRFVDRDKLHYADFTGRTFSVRGPSIVPRPPQGRPVVVADTASPHARDLAARHADVALVHAQGPAAARAAREELLARAEAAGRDPGTLRVLAVLTVDLGGGEYAAVPSHGGGGPRAGGAGSPAVYRGGPVDLAELVTAWHDTGAVDGFHFVPADPDRDLERLINGTVALLQHRGRFRTFYPGATLRDHLGLARPASRYAAARGADRSATTQGEPA